jgi:outer membrane protein assembly factor BamB
MLLALACSDSHGQTPFAPQSREVDASSEDDCDTDRDCAGDDDIRPVETPVHPHRQGTGTPSQDAAVEPSDAPDAGPPQPGSSFKPKAIADSAVAYQIDIAHSGSQSDDTFRPPFDQKWDVDLKGQVSYPLIVDGRIFVTVRASQGTELNALDEEDGHVLWGPKPLSGTFWWSGIAYDEGRVYAVNTDGILSAFDAESGERIWTQQLEGQYAFSSPPTAADGLVFLGGAGSGGTLYAVDGASGETLWTQRVENGDNSSPAVSSDGVFVSYACVQAYAFAPLDGEPLWHHMGPCEGGGGATPVLANGRLYARDWASSNLVLDARDGSLVSEFNASQPPAFDSAGRGFFVSGMQLQANEVENETALWTAAADGTLSPPIAANDMVYVASNAGTLYAFDAETGEVADMTTLPAKFNDVGMNVSGPPAALAIGDGLLVVPADTHLVAF